MASAMSPGAGHALQQRLPRQPWPKRPALQSQSGLAEQRRQAAPAFLKQGSFVPRGAPELGFFPAKKKPEPSSSGQNHRRRLLLFGGLKHCAYLGFSGQNYFGESNSAGQSCLSDGEFHGQKPDAEGGFTKGKSVKALGSAGLKYRPEPHGFERQHGARPRVTGLEKSRETDFATGKYQSQLDFAGEDHQRRLNKSEQGKSIFPGFHRYHLLKSKVLSGQHHDRDPVKPSDSTRTICPPERRCNGPNSRRDISAGDVQRRSRWTRRWTEHRLASVSQKLRDEPGSDRQAQERETGVDLADQNPVPVRDQIRQVVLDLEGVLEGLKQVHVEMKEVVQQIEKLTSSLDLTGEEPSNSYPNNTLCSSSSSGVMVSSLSMGQPEGSKQGDAGSPYIKLLTGPHPPTPNPAVILTSLNPDRVTLLVPSSRSALSATEERPGLVWLPRVQGQSPQGGTDSGLAAPDPHSQNQAQARPVNQRPTGRPAGPNSLQAARSKKPPPYPRNGERRSNHPVRTSKTPPYPGKHRLLSTTV
nr:PREDICTED: uncharacterized protein LOC107079693 [Lepisosteus oculatus]XP_015221284.1 PREDICTED: uncharacterized protein LOC107079693 [Lepisosteus oculatus]